MTNQNEFAAAAAAAIDSVREDVEELDGESVSKEMKWSVGGVYNERLIG